jgi:hypothetical protein
MKLSYDEMFLKLQKRFPDLEILDNTEYSKESKPMTGFWLKNGDEIPYSNKNQNTLYRSMNANYLNYEFEIYKRFDSWCKKYGFYASSENYTLQLFKL